MIRNYFLLWLFGIWACLLTTIVAREAILNGELEERDAEVAAYTVSVQLPDHGHVCGGGIVGHQFILTAAHCVLNRTRHLRSPDIFILAGTVNLNKTGPPAVSIPVEKVFFPKEFHPTVEFNHGDIAVLKLVNVLQLTEFHLEKLYLPTNYNPNAHGVNEVTNSDRAFITGFGWKGYRKIRDNWVGVSDGRLREGLIKVLSDDICEKAYPYGAIESSRHLCARGIDKVDRVCNGDTGGPLMQFDESDVMSFIGILSQIPAHCDERHEFPIYTRVTHYVGMILNVMERDRDPNMISLHT